MKDVAFEFVDALRAPILTHAQAWADCIPARVLQIIVQARLVSLMKQEELATIPETVAFIMTRTFEAPMDHDWTDIYTHLSCTMCRDWFNEDHFEAVKAPKELTDYQTNYLLRPLRKWIWERRRKYVKQQLKSEEMAKKEKNIQQQEITFEQQPKQTVTVVQDTYPFDKAQKYKQWLETVKA
jgi:hypothetical protein